MIPILSAAAAVGPSVSAADGGEIAATVTAAEVVVSVGATSVGGRATWRGSATTPSLVVEAEEAAVITAVSLATLPENAATVVPVVGAVVGPEALATVVESLVTWLGIVAKLVVVASVGMAVDTVVVVDSVVVDASTVGIRGISQGNALTGLKL